MVLVREYNSFINDDLSTSGQSGTAINFLINYPKQI